MLLRPLFYSKNHVLTKFITLALTPATIHIKPTEMKKRFLVKHSPNFRRPPSFSHTGPKVIVSISAGKHKANSIPTVEPIKGMIFSREGIKMATNTRN